MFREIDFIPLLLTGRPISRRRRDLEGGGGGGMGGPGGGGFWGVSSPAVTVESLWLMSLLESSILVNRQTVQNGTFIFTFHMLSVRAKRGDFLSQIRKTFWLTILNQTVTDRTHLLNSHILLVRAKRVDLVFFLDISTLTIVFKFIKIIFM